MKKAISRHVVYLLVAVAVVATQWLWVRVGDDFEIVQRAGEHHKVFTWGFPVRIVECDSALDLATPSQRVPLYVAGNIVVWVALMAITDLITRGFRTKHWRLFQARA
jgi:hypothetical protein